MDITILPWHVFWLQELTKTRYLFTSALTSGISFTPSFLDMLLLRSDHNALFSISVDVVCFRPLAGSQHAVLHWLGACGIFITE
jgi:hypothetical protein